jgi:hypothetical protein
MRWFNPLACLLIVAWMLAAGCAPKPEETTYRGVSLRPPGAVEVEGAVPQNSIYMFDQRDFKGKVTRIENVTSQAPGATERVGGRSDSMTSLKWDLPPGVVVVFYENADATGDTFTIWGRGQLPSVSLWAFNDKVSRWAWYSTGSGSAASASIDAGRIPPHGTRQTTTNLPADTIELYADRDLKGTLTSISPVTRQPQDYEDVKGANDRMTSLRWNLPEGVVVVLYDNIDGTGRQFSIWGKGEVDTVTPWNFNDRVSSYAWYRIGEASTRGTASSAVTVNRK